jgi:hypothetical protein
LRVTELIFEARTQFEDADVACAVCNSTGVSVWGKSFERITELARTAPLFAVVVVELEIAEPVVVVVQYWRTSEYVELPPICFVTYETTFWKL